jgi:hypothetical protein
MNKAMIESYLRNLLGQVVGSAVVVSQATGVSLTDFSQHEYLLVANALWASIVPVAIRYAKKSDPAFGLVATVAVAEVTKKIDTAVKKTVKKKTAPAVKKKTK